MKTHPHGEKTDIRMSHSCLLQRWLNEPLKPGAFVFIDAYSDAVLDVVLIPGHASPERRELDVIRNGHTSLDFGV
jgi:hypothetical protein